MFSHLNLWDRLSLCQSFFLLTLMAAYIVFICYFSIFYANKVRALKLLKVRQVHRELLKSVKKRFKQKEQPKFVRKSSIKVQNDLIMRFS